MWRSQKQWQRSSTLPFPLWFVVYNPLRGLDLIQFKKSNVHTLELDTATTSVFRNGYNHDTLVLWLVAFLVVMLSTLFYIFQRALGNTLGLYLKPQQAALHPFWLRCLSTHLINGLKQRTTLSLHFEMMLCDWALFCLVVFWNTDPNLEQNLSFMKHQLVKSRYLIIIVFFTSIIFTAAA